MSAECSGSLSKMVALLGEDGTVCYQLPLGENRVGLNELIGKPIALDYQGAIHCIHCGRKTNKSFSQGYCYPCFKKLPQCDICIVSPEKCHYQQGTCRDASWGDSFCMTDHIVYLANSSGLKVGITRASQIPTRWIDQGATQGLPILRVGTRHLSGLVEVMCKDYVNDRTNWRAMLKGVSDPIDLKQLASSLIDKIRPRLEELQQRFGLQSVTELTDANLLSIDYPVQHYPAKVSSLSFDKQPRIEGLLMGIRGQYLILENGVLNVRKHTGYTVSVYCA